MDSNPSNPGQQRRSLSEEQVEEFLRDGVLTVDNVLSSEQVAIAREGLQLTLRGRGIDTDFILQSIDEMQSSDILDQLRQQTEAFARLSSTNGSGGVLDLFYEDWKLDMATNADLFHMTTQLWKAAYCHEGETKELLQSQHKDELMFRWHPYGPFDCETGYLYMDRIGYRLPTSVSEGLGAFLHSTSSRDVVGKKKKKAMALQRSLTPHLDCCPEGLYHKDSNKWRPIQCMISLTDSLQPNMGGFEAARGFHRKFDKWAHERVLPVPGSNDERDKAPSLCVGEYTHIRPKEDRYVMDQVSHVPVAAGSAVFWDNRIPHANSYRHDGETPRAVVYCSFLPNVPLNQVYIKTQLQDFLQRRPPTGSDQWRGSQLETSNNFEDGVSDIGGEDDKNELSHEFSPLGRKLMGLDPW